MSLRGAKPLEFVGIDINRCEPRRLSRRPATERALHPDAADHMQETSMHFIPRETRASSSTSVLAASALLGAVEASAGGVITTGLTSLGVNDSGELNFFGEYPGGPGGCVLGVDRGAGDAISPGCACEGWGVATTSEISRRPRRSPTSPAAPAATKAARSASAHSATPRPPRSRMSGAAITIRYAYGPSLQADTFQAQVTISNTGSSAVSDLVYRRAMDWDVPPGHRQVLEYVTHGQRRREPRGDPRQRALRLEPRLRVVRSAELARFDRDEHRYRQRGLRQGRPR